MAIKNTEFIEGVARLKAKYIIKRDTELADMLGYSRSTISEYLNNKKAVSDIMMQKLYQAFPEARSEQSSKKGNKRKGLGSEVAEDAALYSTASKFKDAVILDLGDSLVMHVPLVNKYAYAGYLTGYGDAEYVDSLPRVPFAVDKEYKGTYIAFEVKGESMNNGTRAGYIEGDILLCREVPQHHWQSKLHIKKWDFVIVTKTDGILIKQISKHNTTTGDLTLHSLNEDYDDIPMNLSQVAKIFNVVQVSYKK